MRNALSECVLIPLISGQLLGQHHRQRFGRAAQVLIPLISGQLLGLMRCSDISMNKVLIPLISGQLLGLLRFF